MKRVQDRWNSICKIILQVIIYLLLIISLPFIILITVLFLFYKKVILKQIVKYFKPKLLQLLNHYEAFQAVDRFWENSRSSCGLLLILDGNVELEQIRQDFFNQVVEAKKSSEDSSESKLFPRLTQIPQSFGGYYFWTRANYFLIHEHIRLIDHYVDEVGLKKFAGTVLTLPFPNKRPLWEILVFPKYSYKNSKSHENTKEQDCCKEYSALVVRFHQSISDPDLVMEMISLLCKSANYSVHSLKISEPEVTSYNVNEDMALKSDTNTYSPVKLDQVTTFFKTPKCFYNFVSQFFKPSPINSMFSYENNAVVSWSNISEEVLTKITRRQNITSSAVTLSTIIDALTSSGVIETVEDGEKKKDATSISILFSRKNPIQNSLIEYAFLNNYSENPLTIINNQLVNLKNENAQGEMSNLFLKFLAVFPHHVARYISFHWLKGPIINYYECNTINLEKNDLIFLGKHNFLDVIPLWGLNFRHTAVSATTIKFQNSLKISLTMNSSLCSMEHFNKTNSSSLPTKSHTADKQNRADQIVENLSKEFDKTFEDIKDENGFVRISIA